MPTAISVVLPAHNEELLLASTVGAVVTAMTARGLEYEIVIVENGSRDASGEIAATAAASNGAIRVRSLPHGNYGEALAAGIAAAAGDIIVLFDVDLYDFDFVDDALLKMQSGADLVIASKRAVGAVDRRPAIRRVLTSIFLVLLRALVGLPVSDAHGMKVLRRARIGPIAARCELRGSLFDVELVVRAANAGLRVLEVPVTVEELRPPRTGLVRRSLESLRGALALRRILRREAAARTTGAASG